MLRDGARIDQGVCITSHASQCRTVDQVVVLPDGADAKARYVSLSRARDGLHTRQGRIASIGDATRRTQVSVAVPPTFAKIDAAIQRSNDALSLDGAPSGNGSRDGNGALRPLSSSDAGSSYQTDFRGAGQPKVKARSSPRWQSVVPLHSQLRVRRWARSASLLHPINWFGKEVVLKFRETVQF
jgi:hypothetical protein